MNEWMSTEHFGIRGCWIALGGAGLALIVLSSLF